MFIELSLYLFIPSNEIKTCFCTVEYCSIILSIAESSIFLNNIESWIRNGKHVSFKITKSNSIKSENDLPVPVLSWWSKRYDRLYIFIWGFFLFLLWISLLILISSVLISFSILLNISDMVSSKSKFNCFKSDITYSFSL